MTFKKTIGIIFALLILAFLIYLYVSFPKHPTEVIEELTVNVSFRGSVDVGLGGDNPRIDWLIVETLNYPEDTERQHVLGYGASEPFSIKEDEWGNHYLELNFSNPQLGTNSYSVWALVRTRKSTSDSSDKVLNEYVEPSYKVQSDDPEIKTALVSITTVSRTELQALKAITRWVFQNVAYNASYEGAVRDARWVLQNREGVCVEFSHLEEALLRAQNIPARHVYGVAPYDYLESWREHSWVEANINGVWVPQDPTWGQTELVDAAHIKLAVIPDHSYVQERVYTSGMDLKLESVEQPRLSVEVIEIKKETSVFSLLVEYL